METEKKEQKQNLGKENRIITKREKQKKTTEGMLNKSKSIKEGKPRKESKRRRKRCT